MKKYLLGIDMGGWKLEMEAAQYLDWMYLNKVYTKESDEYCIKLLNMPELYKEDFKHRIMFNEHIKKDNDGRYYWEGDKDFKLVATNYVENKETNRTVLLPMFEALEYDYSTFDELNIQRIRIAKAEDDAPVYITTDPEFGVESLAFRTKYYKSPDDFEDMCKFQIETFFKEVWNGKTGKFTYKDLVMDLNRDEMSVFRFKGSHYGFLRRLNYYKKNPTYEIIEFDTESNLFFSPHIKKFLLTQKEFENIIKSFNNVKL